MRKIKYVCEECGSEDVEMEATGWWNISLQRHDWEWTYTFCPTCMNEVGVIAQFLPPEVPENVKVI